MLEDLLNMLFSCMDRDNHNVVTSALETLQQVCSIYLSE